MSFDPLIHPSQISGIHSIEASAGTGKTYSISVLWLRLIIEENMSVDNILVSTFTTAATAELCERLLHTLQHARHLAELACTNALPDQDSTPEAAIIRRFLAASQQHTPSTLLQHLQQALSLFDLAAISTIHGFCSSIMQRNVLEMGADPEAEVRDSCTETIDEIVGDHCMRHADTAIVSFKDAQKISRALNSEAHLQDHQIHSGRIEDSTRSQADITDSLRSFIDIIPDRLDTLKMGRSTKKTLRIVQQLVDRDKKIEKFADGPWGKLCENWPELTSAIEAVQNNIVSEKNKNIAELVHAIRKDLPQRKTQQGFYTFDDILINVRKTLIEQGADSPLAQAVRTRYQAVIIDECQDSDAVQIDVFRRLFCSDQHGITLQPCKALIVIGDPKQSIYRFRGADISSYRALLAQAHSAPEMNVNYRSDQELISTLNDLYAAHPVFNDEAADADTDTDNNNNDNKTRIAYIPVSANANEQRLWDTHAQACYCIWSAEDKRNQANRDIAQQVAAECQRLLSSNVRIQDRHHPQTTRALRTSDIAILANGHSELSLIRRALSDKNIPCQQAGRGLGNVLGSDEALDFLYWLRMLGVIDSGAGQFLSYMATFSASALGGLSAQDIHNLHGQHNLANSAARQLQYVHNARKDLETLHFQGPLPMLLQHLQRQQRQEHRNTLSQHNGERRLTNWRHIASILQEQWGTGMRSAQVLQRLLSRSIADHDSAQDAQLMKLETDLPAIQLNTIHSSKGLEYPIVFCPYLWHTKKPKMSTAIVRDQNGGFIDIGSPALADNIERALQQEDDEKQRLLYVALTRARHRLYIGMAAVTSKIKQAAHIATLLQLPEEDTDSWYDILQPRILTANSATSTHVAATKGNSADDDGGDNDNSDTTTDLVCPPTVDSWKGALHRIASFSSLAAQNSNHGSAKDHDEEAYSAPNLEPGLLAGLGGGTILGNKIHNILEEIIGNGKDIAEVVHDEQLYPSQQSEHEDDTQSVNLVDIMSQIMHAPMQFADGPAVSFMELRKTSIAEMHFLMPLSHLSSERLSQALLCDQQICNNTLFHDWACEVAHRPFKTFRGFMQGFIDLTFEYNGRWYILDYKTNQLENYLSDSLKHEMIHADYLLQSRIYALALHRHLAQNIVDYNYQQHFGGCVYAFIRGFPDHGIWYDRPSREGIEALDALLATQANTDGEIL